MFFIFLFLAFILQASGIFNCNFIFLTTIFFSLKNKTYKACFFGFLSGFLLDCIEIRHFGVNTLSFTLIAIIINMLFKRIYLRFDTCIFILFLGSIFVSSLSSLLFFLLEGFFLNPYFILKEALINSLIGGFIYLLLRKRLYEEKYRKP